MERLRDFRESDWHGILEWLDVSGMALYSLDRLQQIGAVSVLPGAIEEALTDRLQRNRQRMCALHREAKTISDWLRGEGIPFAMLKGMTLAPDVVPDIALRSQSDLDFLVENQSRDLVVQYLQQLGYHIHAESGGTLELTAPVEDPSGLAIMYSARAPKGLDLHCVSGAGGETNRLARRVMRSIDGMETYALAPPDILMLQAHHLLKHLCSEFTRLSWVLEFRRHVLAREGDTRFWREAAQIVREHQDGDLAMAVALWLARDLFGDIPMTLPEQWHDGTLPARVRLWLSRYTRQVLLGPPRSKLYALLHVEIPSASAAPRSVRAILFPRCLPARVTEPRPQESLRQRLERGSIQTRFVVSRLGFHLIEGLRFGVEALRWRRAVARVEQ